MPRQFRLAHLYASDEAEAKDKSSQLKGRLDYIDGIEVRLKRPQPIAQKGKQVKQTRWRIELLIVGNEDYELFCVKLDFQGEVFHDLLAPEMEGIPERFSHWHEVLDDAA